MAEQENANCEFPVAANIKVEMQKTTDATDFNLNLLVNGIRNDNFACSGNLCEGEVLDLSEKPIEIAQIDLTILTDDGKIEIEKFLEEDPCDVTDDEFILDDLPDIRSLCNRGKKLEFEAPINTTFNIIPFLLQSRSCITNAPTEAPTRDFPDQKDDKENDGEGAVIGAASGLALIFILCAGFYMLKKRKERDAAKELFKNGNKRENQTLELVSGQNRGTDIVSDLRDSISKFDTKDISRISGLSMLTTHTASTRKSVVTERDTDNFSRIKSIVANDSRKYSEMSKLIAVEVQRLSLTTMEDKYKDVDINERVLNKVIPFIQLNLHSHKENRQMQKFDLKSAPKVSLKFYISRLIMGLNNWFYQDEKSIEIGLRCLFLSILYLEKLPQKVKGFQLTNINIYKVIATCMLVAAKFTEDEVITNSYWADVCGYKMNVVNELEALLCFKFTFSFDVDPSDLSNLFALFNAKEGAH